MALKSATTQPSHTDQFANVIDWIDHKPSQRICITHFPELSEPRLFFPTLLDHLQSSDIPFLLTAATGRAAAILAKQYPSANPVLTVHRAIYKMNAASGTTISARPELAAAKIVIIEYSQLLPAVTFSDLLNSCSARILLLSHDSSDLFPTKFPMRQLHDDHAAQPIRRVIREATHVVAFSLEGTTVERTYLAEVYGRSIADAQANTERQAAIEGLKLIVHGIFSKEFLSTSPFDSMPTKIAPLIDVLSKLD